MGREIRPGQIRKDCNPEEDPLGLSVWNPRR